MGPSYLRRCRSLKILPPAQPTSLDPGNASDRRLLAHKSMKGRDSQSAFQRPCKRRPGISLGLQTLKVNESQNSLATSKQCLQGFSTLSAGGNHEPCRNDAACVPESPRKVHENRRKKSKTSTRIKDVHVWNDVNKI